MNRILRRLGQTGRDFASDRRGVAAIEFAIIASLLLLLMGGGYDLSHLVTAQRDTQRASVELSQTLAACTTSPCVLNAGQTVLASQSNAFGTDSTLKLSWAYVSRVNDQIIVNFGNMTYLPKDVEVAARSVLPGNNDNGVCSLVTAKVKSIGILKLWPSGTFGEKRYFLCTLQSKNVKVV